MLLATSLQKAGRAWQESLLNRIKSTWDGTMIESSRWLPVLLILLFLNMWVGQTKCSAATPQKTHVPALLSLNTFSGDRSLPNGIEVYSSKAILQVIALRDDVIRVRIARD
jgi:hypothetical protein